MSEIESGIKLGVLCVVRSVKIDVSVYQARVDSYDSVTDLLVGKVRSGTWVRSIYLVWLQARDQALDGA